MGHSDGIERWQVADATAFMVRGTDYMSTKKKVNSRGSIYRQFHAHPNLHFKLCFPDAAMWA